MAGKYLNNGQSDRPSYPMTTDPDQHTPQTPPSGMNSLEQRSAQRAADRNSGTPRRRK